ncbi:Putative Rho GTPase activation protein [Septoria linicola]|uniref:Rho GTPase activation protein n=1 Tax=Septoria linicola TaxID=215465 RepID=A0A9Q9AN68_9PEZI|nr:putative Rho GTPase activation protein [Septoria linicola]USW47831.1 Putative Rho GTPase activation protein [Septoria linicola]
MTTSGPSTASAGAGGPRAAPQFVQTESIKEKKDLASWWKNFKRSDKKPQDQASPQGIFGIPLQQSIRYANVAISLFNDEGQSYIYGYVPIVVAKCGVFLKEKATDVEGIFRLAGSEKRIKELKVAFDSPDRYGKGLDWTGYTVHDAANILRRYFNQLPEPIIPLEFYQRFRDPLRNHQAQAVGVIESQSPSHGEFNHEAAIRAYQALITELPPLNRQLLLYILDLLAVFASKSDMNKMTTPNLAAIFQPGILSHPQHDMAPQEYRLSQDVLIFLIENQDSFLIGMQGTAADPETVRDVQSGSQSKPPTTPTTPGRSKTIIGRSSSNSSVAAESVRKWGSIRRNVSVSSKHSKGSENAPAPSSPAPGTPTTGVNRSNTVPSRRGGGAAQSPRFPREKNSSDPSTPRASGSASGQAPLEQQLIAETQSSVQSTPIAATAPVALFPAPPEITSASSSEATTPLAVVVGDGVKDYTTPRKDTAPLLAPGSTDISEKSTERSFSNTPTTTSTSGRKFLDILKQSPASDGDGRKPNKLQKRRAPGSTLSSAHSSSHSLHEDVKDGIPRSPIFPSSAQHAAAGPEIPSDKISEAANHRTVPAASVQATPPRNLTDATLRPTISPSNSFTDQSDADLVGDDMPSADEPEKRKRSRWRFSRTQNKLEQPSTPGTTSPLGATSTREHAMSRSTIGSGGSHPRRSFQEPAPIAAVATDIYSEDRQPAPIPSVQTSGTSDTVFSDSEREKKGPMSWLRNKIQERKDKDVEKRSRTPERGHERNKSRQDLHNPTEDNLPVRGKSIEQTRGIPEEPTQATIATGTVSSAEQERTGYSTQPTHPNANGAEERKADGTQLETRQRTGTEPDS